MARSKKVYKSTSRRDEILDAAAVLFSRKGFDATTTQDIAEKIGILKGSLYYYFDSKDQMLHELIDQNHEIFTRNLATLNAIDVGPVEKMWAYIYTNVKGNVDNHVRATIFFNHFSSVSASRRKHVVEMRDRHDQMVRDLISAGQAKRLMRSDIEPKITAIALLSMCNATDRWYKPRGPWKADHIARSYADIAVASLVADPSQLEHIERDQLVEKLTHAAASVADESAATA